MSEQQYLYFDKSDGIPVQIGDEFWDVGLSAWRPTYDATQMPTGLKYRRPIAEPKPAGARYVAGFMFDVANKQVALIRKTKPAWQAGKLNGIGGKIEDGESPEAAMVREFLEETGCNTDRDDWSHFASLSEDPEKGERWSVDFSAKDKCQAEATERQARIDALEAEVARLRELISEALPIVGVRAYAYGLVKKIEAALAEGDKS
jgi:8-oxo-dGTP pyrophosphatase MutT (NUDIX family)